MALLSLLMLSCLARYFLLASGVVAVCVYALAAVVGVLEALLVQRRNAAIEAANDPTRCRECGYLLRRLAEARCPEYGTAFDPGLLERKGVD